MMSRPRVLQRAGIFGEYVVLGSQYQDHAGKINWYVALLPDWRSNVTIYHVVDGDLPDALTGERRHAVIQAVYSWDQQPAGQPAQLILEADQGRYFSLRRFTQQAMATVMIEIIRGLAARGKKLSP